MGFLSQQLQLNKEGNIKRNDIFVNSDRDDDVLFARDQISGADGEDLERVLVRRASKPLPGSSETVLQPRVKFLVYRTARSGKSVMHTGKRFSPGARDSIR